MSDIQYSKYVSNQYGFELEYPSNWIVKEHSAMFLASFMESNDKNSPSLNVTIQNLEGLFFSFFFKQIIIIKTIY